MSSPGFNPLAIVAPDLYAKQIAIQRQQALAQSLLQQGESNPGSAQYGGLRNAGNMLLGAFLAKRGDQSMANLYAPQPDSSQATSQPSGQVSNAPTPMPQGSPDSAPLSAQSGPTPQISNAPSQQPANVAMGQALTGKPKTIPDAMNGMIPDLPGLTHTQSMLAYFQSPQAYFTALAAAKGPTPEIKNAEYGTGGQNDLSRQMVLGADMKAASQAIRPGGGNLNMATGQITTMPGANGVQTTFPQGAGGPAQMSMAPGAALALQQSGTASGLGAAAAKPAIGYDKKNQPVATNQAVMATGGQPQEPLGLRTNNPGNLQPGGQEARYSTPSEGILRASANLDTYAKQGINTLSGIISKWAPPTSGNNTAAYIADASKRLGVDPNIPLNLQDPRVKGAVLDAIFTHENGPQAMAQSGAQPPGRLLPEIPQGVAPYLQSQGKDAAERHDSVVAAAAESPMRINVLDNIIKLSQSGVGTGPGSEFQNSVLGYAANVVPGLSKTQDKVGQFQELQKFMYQNALRNWQAAGGTGTDSQLESAAKANPNDHLFPQALQTIAKWGKASELAVQGKANAQDAFLSQNGQTPANQIKFESTWRNAFDPKVFQYSLMSPQEKQTFAQQDLKTPQAAKAFIAKQQSLKQLGALQ